MARIELDHIRHSYLARPRSESDYALKEVNHVFEDGGAYALLGPSGCGKTTLLSIISGLLTPSEGHLRFNDEDVTERTTEQRNIAQVFQFPVIYDTMTVAQNLELGRLKRETGRGVRWDLDRIFEYFPRIRERIDTPADLLSGGEQQMVAVARALSGDVRVLLLDEPFEGLAPAVVEQLFESFDRLRHEVSIIIEMRPAMKSLMAPDVPL